MKPILFTFERATTATQKRAWEALSDTETFNRLVSAGFSFRAQDDGSVVGSLHKLGMTITWNEEPFAFRVPHWFELERRFHNGPAEKLRVRCEIVPTEGGSIIRYALSVYPKSVFFKPILAIDLRATTKRHIDAALDRIAQALGAATPDENPFGVAPQLEASAEARLKAALPRLGAFHLAQRLLGFLRAAPIREQARICPLKLARAWRADFEDVIELLLTAVDERILDVTLDIVCPACKLPRAATTFTGSHCDSCGVRFDPTFPQHMAVHFRPSAAIRRLAFEPACVQSPAARGEIVAQDFAGPEEEIDLATPLEPGIYHLHTVPEVGQRAVVEVVGGGRAVEAIFVCDDRGIAPPLTRVADPQKLVVTNRSSTRRLFVLERTDLPPGIVTVGRLFAENARFRDAVREVPFLSQVTMADHVVLAVRFYGERIEPPAATLVYEGENVVFLLFDDMTAALAHAEALIARASVGSATGLTFELTRNERRVPMGPAVDDAYGALERARPHEWLIREADGARHETAVAIARAGFVTHPSGLSTRTLSPLSRLVRSGA